MFETTYSKTFDVSSFIVNYNINYFEVEVEIENQTLSCKISGEHQIQTLRSVGHWRPGWGLIGHLGPSQMAISHLRLAAI